MMPEAYHGERPRLCWNCDRETSAVIAATLQSPSRGQATLWLCRDCYATSRSLVTEAIGSGPGAGRGSTVLVVDDDPEVRTMLGYALTAEGYNVVAAGNGLEALYRACQGMPHVVVLDLRMPTMDGRTFVSAWRQVAAGGSVPIVATSAYEPGATAAELGVAAFLPKPFEAGALVSTVDHLLKATA